MLKDKDTEVKIVVLDGYTLNPGDLSWDNFKALGDFVCYDRTREDQVVERIGDSEIVLTNKTHITKSVLEACPTVKYIGVLATGYNVVDIEAAQEKHIPVCNIPSYGTTAVAQFTFAHMLNICHHVQDHWNSVKAGDWTNSKDFCYWNYPLTELAGKRLGIIGFGRIGQAVAKIAQAFGMSVLAYDENQNRALESDTMKYVSLDSLFNNSDIITLHCPLFPATQEIINRENIEKMKKGVILINTSRGGLISESALADGLNSEKIRAAGLDVVSTEPIQKDNVLLKTKNCFITPHIAWAPIESRSRLMNIALDNVESFISGGVKNRVN